jgi:hypothetical protein
VVSTATPKQYAMAPSPTQSQKATQWTPKNGNDSSPVNEGKAACRELDLYQSIPGTSKTILLGYATKVPISH